MYTASQCTLYFSPGSSDSRFRGFGLVIFLTFWLRMSANAFTGPVASALMLAARALRYFNESFKQLQHIFSILLQLQQ